MVPGAEGDHSGLLARGGQPYVPYKGSVMPPDAVNEGKVAPLSYEDRRTILRWIDLGCPIDLDFNPAKPQATCNG